MTAYEVADKIFTRANILDEHPDIGRKGKVKGTREFVLTGLPFILVYKPSTPTYVWRVLHGAQQWPPQEYKSSY